MTAVTVDEVPVLTKQFELEVVADQQPEKPIAPKRLFWLSVAFLTALQAIAKAGAGVFAAAMATHQSLVPGLAMASNELTITYSSKHLALFTVLLVAVPRMLVADPFNYRLGSAVGEVTARKYSQTKARNELRGIRRVWRFFWDIILAPWRFVFQPIIRLILGLTSWVMDHGGTWGALLVVAFRPGQATMIVLGATRKLKVWQIAIADVVGTVGQVVAYYYFGSEIIHTVSKFWPIAVLALVVGLIWQHRRTVPSMVMAVLIRRAVRQHRRRVLTLVGN